MLRFYLKKCEIQILTLNLEQIIFKKNSLMKNVCQKKKSLPSGVFVRKIYYY